MMTMTMRVDVLVALVESPLFLCCFQMDIPFNRVYESFHLFVSCAPQLYFVRSWLGRFSPSCSYLDVKVPSQAAPPILKSYILSSHATTSCFKYTNSVFLPKRQRHANTPFRFCGFYLTLFFVSKQILVACNFNSPSDLDGT